MLDSLRPHGLQPTRLLCSWDFPGKSIGVGCHCLLVYIYPLLFEPPSHLPDSYTSRLIQSPCVSFLSHPANSHWQSILHMVMHDSMLLSTYISASPPFSPCAYVYSLCLFLHCCPANKLFRSIFLDSIYMHWYTIFVFLFLTYFTLYNKL